jgi:predicted neuraminidase
MRGRFSMAGPNEAEKKEARLPTFCPQNHASNLLPLKGGDLLCVWFSGTQEGMADISIYLSRLKTGETVWSLPVKLSEDPTKSEQNPVLFMAPDGKLWLLWTSQKAGNQDTAEVRYRISEDNGYTWNSIRVLFDKPGTFVRQPGVVLDNGDWLIPIFYCKAPPGGKWVGDDDYSAVKISTDQGKTWSEYVVPNSTGCVHMNVEKQSDGSLLALFRSRWADWIYVSQSRDNGRTWLEPVPTTLPNNNSSIQFTRLKNGHLVLVFNNRNATAGTARRTSLYDEIKDDESDQTPAAFGQSPPGKRTAFWGTPRAPLTIAVSEDEGKSWPRMRDLETGDGYCLTNNSKEGLNREYSYPSIKQTNDGLIHITYTYFRQYIKYVCVTEDWVGRKR